ncbi:MAG: aminotransferase class V-fold PLP-dependent enzyme [Pleomorphochaeta sp.]
MLYLNNAATSYPKPQSVIESINKSLQDIPVGQNRSNWKSSNIIELCKKNISKIINNDNSGNIYFTSGATEASNMVISGLDLYKTKPLVSKNEHNCIIRPLYNYYDEIDIEYINSDSLGLVNIEMLESQIKINTKAIFINHCSNVTGIIQDIVKIGKIAKKHNLIYVVDASQSCGCIDIDVNRANIDILIFTAHKSLFGISGLGGFYIRNNVNLKKVKFGGTSTNSHMIKVDKYNREFEVGTQNIVGITALNSGCEYILKEGIVKIQSYENNLIKYLYEKLKSLRNIIIYTDEKYNQGPLLSFNINTLDPTDVAYILENSFEIVIRSGLLCAPIIHKSLTNAKKGSVRVSLSYFNTYEEVDEFYNAIKQICESI